ncbi:MAG: glycosyltransferase [Spirochaetota bacterium]
MKTSDIKKAVILAHYAATGATEELRDWLNSKRVEEVVYIAFPFMNSVSSAVTVSVFRRGKLVRTHESLLRFKRPEPVSYAKDVLYGLWYGMRFCRGADILAGGDNLLACIGLCLKVIAGVKRVMYYMIDYTPVRYANPVLNALYYAFDRIAAYNADQVWPLIEKTIRRRFEDGKLKEKRVRSWQPVAFGTHLSHAKSVDTHAVVYLGGLIRNKGAELFLPVLEELRKKDARYRLVVVGAGDYLAELREDIRRRKLAAWVTLYGHILDFSRVLAILSKTGVGIAPYYPDDPNNFSYNTDMGKLKVYIGCALPVVVTDVPPFARTLAEKKAGRIARYDAKDIADQIRIIVKDHARYRSNARALGEQYTWDKIFTKAFEKIEQ